MAKSAKVLLLTVLLASFAKAQTDIKLIRVDPQRTLPPTLYVSYSDPLPADTSIFKGNNSWQVWRSDGGKASKVIVPVDTSRIDFSIKEIISIGLSNPSLTADQMMSSFWTVQFNREGQPATVLNFTPGKSTQCDGTTPGKKAFLCPPASGAPADISISGTFLAGGGTKPIYSFEFVGGLYSPNSPTWLLGFSPGVSADVEINQNTKPPNNRTTFDPNSITAAFALQRMYKLGSDNPLHLDGLEFDESLPAGEFSRTDQTSNIIFASTVLLGFRPMRGQAHPRIYATLFPVFGIETGKNLDKPPTIDKKPVDLSNFNAIFRGYTGADASFAIMSKDKKTDDFTISGSYRVRLPAFEEPFVETMHQVTTVTLTTKARNWFEGDINYAPWSFKYLTLNAKYQYGELPPLYNFVDQKFTFGITFKAIQSNKPTVTAVP
jgi:hypothetical protein